MTDLKDKIIGKRKEGVFFVLRELQKEVDPRIKELLDLEVGEEFREVLHYQIATGGKRLRAALVILGCLSCDGRGSDSLYAAAAVEILHNNSLMIDDILDNSGQRRGKETIWKKHGVAATQCLSFLYAASVFQGADRSPAPGAISERFSSALKRVFQGEIKDILLEQGGREGESYIQHHRYRDASLDDYLEMVSLKTASLMEVSCEIGGLCAGADDDRLRVLREFGSALGVVFQIRDDILDIYGQESKFGKKIGQDIYERKLGNILVVFALEDLKGGKRKELLSLLRRNELTAGDVDKAVGIIKGTEARDRAEELARLYYQKGERAWRELPRTEYSEILKELLEFAVSREV